MLVISASQVNQFSLLHFLMISKCILEAFYVAETRRSQRFVTEFKQPQSSYWLQHFVIDSLLKYIFCSKDEAFTVLQIMYLYKSYMPAHCKGQVHCYAFLSPENTRWVQVHCRIHDSRFFVRFSQQFATTHYINSIFLAGERCCERKLSCPRIQHHQQPWPELEWSDLKLKLLHKLLGHQAPAMHSLRHALLPSKLTNWKKHSHGTYFKICLASLAIFWGPSGGILVKLLRSLPLQ